MFEPRFATLSDRYHLLAPDYPPLRTQRLAGPYGAFAYTFDRYAEIVNRFTEALGLRRHTLYMQDYGGPVGFRMLLAHPEVVPAEAWKECRGRLRASQNKRNANIRNRAPAPGPPRGLWRVGGLIQLNVAVLRLIFAQSLESRVVVDWQPDEIEPPVSLRYRCISAIERRISKHIATCLYQSGSMSA